MQLNTPTPTHIWLGPQTLITIFGYILLTTQKTRGHAEQLSSFTQKYNADIKTDKNMQEMWNISYYMAVK